MSMLYVLPVLFIFPVKVPASVLFPVLVVCILRTFYIPDPFRIPDDRFSQYMKKYIRKADIILFVVLVIAGLAASAVLAMSHSGGDTVIIESGGELYATYPLAEDRVVIVPSPQEKVLPAHQPDDSKPASEQFTHYNVVTISGGKVLVSEASCKNQVCVKHSGISLSGESIVCLPNRLLVRIEGGGKGGGYDSVTS